MAEIPTYSPIGSPGTALAEQLVAAPEIRARREATVAQDQAVKAQSDAAATDAHTKQLQVLIRGAQASPEFAESPLFRQAVENHLKSVGMAVPLGPDGHVDVKALERFTSPIKPYAEWTAKEIADARALPPELRHLPPDAPESLKTSPAVVPITPVAESKIYTDLDSMLKTAGSAKLPKNVLLANIQSARQRLATAGLSTAPVDVYLNADGTDLSDMMKEQIASDYAQSEMTKMDRLGIAAVDRAQVQNRLLQERMREFDQKQNLAERKFTLSERREQADEANKASLAAKRTADVQQGWQRVQAEVTNAMTNKNRLAQATANQRLQAFAKLWQDAVNQRDANLRSLQNAVTQRGKNAPLNPELVNQTSALDDLIKQIGPEYAALQAQVTGQPARDYTLVTGSPSTVSGGEGVGPKAGAPVPGIAGWKFTGKRREDGALEVTDGKTTRYVVK